MLVIKRHNLEGCILFTADGNIRVSFNIKDAKTLRGYLCIEAPRSVRVLREELLPKGHFKEMPPTPTPAEMELKEIIERASVFLKSQGYPDAATIIDNSVKAVFEKYRIE